MFRQENKKWIDAHYDPVANLYTFTQCIYFSDIHADGDNKLIIADLGTGTSENQIKLKVYKGTTLKLATSDVTKILIVACYSMLLTCYVFIS